MSSYTELSDAMAGNGPPLKKPRFLDVEEAVASQWIQEKLAELDPTADFAKTALGRIPKTVLLKLTAEDLADALKGSIQNDGVRPWIARALYNCIHGPTPEAPALRPENNILFARLLRFLVHLLLVGLPDRLS